MFSFFVSLHLNIDYVSILFSMQQGGFDAPAARETDQQWENFTHCCSYSMQHLPKLLWPLVIANLSIVAINSKTRHEN